MKLAKYASRDNGVYGLVATLVLFVTIGGDCTDLPSIPPEDTNIATIRFVDTEPILAVGQSATFLIEARNADGLPIGNPAVLWSSTNNGVAVVTGSSTTGAVCGRGSGTSTIRASDTRGGIRAETQVRVLACTREPCPTGC
jgi:hypothetical protein